MGEQLEGGGGDAPAHDASDVVVGEVLQVEAAGDNVTHRAEDCKAAFKLWNT